MRDLQADLNYINKNTATDELAICKEYLNRAIAAEAEVESLKQQILKLQIKGCMMVKAASVDGIGEPEIVDGKCGGYAGNMDEPHDVCKTCKISSNWEWEG